MMQVQLVFLVVLLESPRGVAAKLGCQHTFSGLNDLSTEHESAFSARRHQGLTAP